MFVDMCSRQLVWEQPERVTRLVQMQVQGRTRCGAGGHKADEVGYRLGATGRLRVDDI